MAQSEITEQQRLIKELEFRTTVTSAMLSTLDLEQILYVILSGITSGDGLGFNRAFLLLSDEKGRVLRGTMALGPATAEEAEQIWDTISRDGLTLNALLPRYETYRSSPAAQHLTQRLSGLTLPMDRLESLSLSPQRMFVDRQATLVAVLAGCLHNRSPFASNALTLVHDIGGTHGEQIQFRNLAIVPLTVTDRLIGVILADNIYTDHLVSDEDLRSLHAFGNLAALAIDRARLHAKTVAMAEVDGLTGVYNRRYYQEEVERLLQVCRGSGETVSIVVFDLDFFKRYNDQYGHLVGDQILKDVARILLMNVRESDKVARYGGEEFVVLLANTLPRPAVHVAEKLCQRVKSTVLANDLIQGLTLSAGVAASNGFESAEQLFKRADTALYQAKGQGRDRVVCWDPSQP